MASSMFFSFTIFATIVLHYHSLLSGADHTSTSYIVHMNHQEKPSHFPTHTDWYTASLRSLSFSSPTASTSAAAGAAPRLLYSYTVAYPGFAAELTPDQAEALRSSDGVIGVHKDTLHTLHTTRTPEFLGLSAGKGLWDPRPASPGEPESDVIIGVIDSGIWPESMSFDDTGMSKVPARWRGKCESGPDFSPKLCNRKLIGARSFHEGYDVDNKGSNETRSPRDHDGHGTHTASTAAGSSVANVSFLGYASGTASGIAPRARVASYKVMWRDGSYGSDLIAAFERAILDGVDVLSISMGDSGHEPIQYYDDVIAVGAFSAMEHGIFVSCSAGNDGPRIKSVQNMAPWIMTVGAGTLDRDFPAYIVLGNNKRFTGVSLYSGSGMGKKQAGLVYSNSSSKCLLRSLDPKLVKGKVVLCDQGINDPVEKGAVVRGAGGIGMILMNADTHGGELPLVSYILPALTVGKKAGDLIKAYVKSNPNPTAVLSFGGTVLNVRPSPMVAALSSRGPNGVSAEILKPDVIGPGVGIIAAWSGAVGPSDFQSDTRRTKFNIISGTSMSCPHISGLAALLKSRHPNWSPSAIKSALITTAYTVDNTNSPLKDAKDGSISTPWAHGAGHVDPQRALSPGLVYDLSTDDYIAFICSMGYSIENITNIANRPSLTCARNFSDPGQLNYPSFSVIFHSKSLVRYTRILTNVGTAGSTYNVSVTAPSSVTVTVKPRKLVFTKVGQRQRYTVTFVSKKGVSLTNNPESGSIVWSNAKTQVRSPVVYIWR